MYKCGDYVFFHLNDKEYEYLVTFNFLYNCNGDNTEIFTDLGMNEEEKMDFCSKAFGYPAKSGCSPCSNINDYEALSRLIEAIEVECKKHQKDTPLIYEGDEITFSGGKLSVPIKYRVEPKFLHALVGDNDRLFKELGMDQPEKVAYCNKAYGYDARKLGIESWPEYKPNDYKVLPKLFDKLIADYGLTITINDKPYKGLKIAEATTKDIKTLAELKSKLDEARLLDRVPSMTKDLIYSNFSRITTTTPIVFTLKDKTLHYTFCPSFLNIKDCGVREGNKAVFKELGINDIAKDLATACYGYEAGNGAWPDYQLNDKKALLRLLYVLSKEYDVKISIDNALLDSYVWSSLTWCATKIERSYDDAITSKATCAEHSFYDAEVLAFQATKLVDRSKLLNHRSPEISLTINHFSLKF